jgi:hypothetical protein
MRGISQLHLPMRKPEDVIPFLGSPGHGPQGASLGLTLNRGTPTAGRARFEPNASRTLVRATAGDWRR